MSDLQKLSLDLEKTQRAFLEMQIENAQLKLALLDARAEIAHLQNKDKADAA